MAPLDPTWHQCLVVSGIPWEHDLPLGSWYTTNLVLPTGPNVDISTSMLDFQFVVEDYLGCFL